MTEIMLNISVILSCHVIILEKAASVIGIASVCTHLSKRALLSFRC